MFVRKSTHGKSLILLVIGNSPGGTGLLSNAWWNFSLPSTHASSGPHPAAWMGTWSCQRGSLVRALTERLTFTSVGKMVPVAFFCPGALNSSALSAWNIEKHEIQDSLFLNAVLTL